ncbi:MAG: CvpA family protein [Betaproteobacteria bacterium]|nr:CvpA family protein [Betaproteobacteria bacterium]
MTLFDIAVLVIVGLSVLLSVIRGLTREVLALAAWVAAFVAANLLAGMAAQWLPEAIPTEGLRLLAGFLCVFLAVLIAMSVLAMVASKLVKSAGLGLEDRLLGGLFGLARGALVVLIIVLLAGLTSLPRQAVWRNALLSDPLEAFAGSIKAWLPADLSQRITYD